MAPHGFESCPTHSRAVILVCLGSCTGPRIGELPALRRQERSGARVFQLRRAVYDGRFDEPRHDPAGGRSPVERRPCVSGDDGGFWIDHGRFASCHNLDGLGAQITLEDGTAVCLATEVPQLGCSCDARMKTFLECSLGLRFDLAEAFQEMGSNDSWRRCHYSPAGWRR